MAEVKKDETRFVIAIYVENQFGVLTRVTSMFTRRGFTLDALTVGVTESPEYSRITLSMSGDGYAKAQMLNQLRKLQNVKKLEILDEKDTIERELLLIKVNNTTEQHQLIMSCVDIFKAKIIDYSTTTLGIEVTGDSDKIDAFIEMIRPVGIIESCRSGIIALSKGSGSMLDTPDLF
ncbi:MAG: acetolactate synthase small subunit [Clostridia bacterium]|nr:acetolactate synthase small subunit [Clostridia bacterium]